MLNATVSNPQFRIANAVGAQNSYPGGGYLSEPDTGLTTFGKLAVRTMSRRNIVIDLSHAGDKAALDAIELSEGPVIFSHSTSRAVVQRLESLRNRGSAADNCAEQCPKLLYPENLAAETLQRGFSEVDVRKVLGENLERVFRTVL